MHVPLRNYVEQFMSESFAAAGMLGEIAHHQRTAYWIAVLKLDASDALIVAGLLHDIERAFFGDWKAGSSDPEKLERHQLQSAAIARELLSSGGFPASVVEEVETLILHHERGGTTAQHVLCDADCIAWFEEKAMRKVRQYREQGRGEEVRGVLADVFQRIVSREAKALVQPWYAEALVALE